MKEILKVVAVVFSILAVAVAVTMLLILLLMPLSVFSCNKLESDTGIETKYALWTGCLVKVNDRYIPLDNWRGERED